MGFWNEKEFVRSVSLEEEEDKRSYLAKDKWIYSKIISGAII